MKVQPEHYFFFFLMLESGIYQFLFKIMISRDSFLKLMDHCCLSKHIAIQVKLTELASELHF